MMSLIIFVVKDFDDERQQCIFMASVSAFEAGVESLLATWKSKMAHRQAGLRAKLLTFAPSDLGDSDGCSLSG